MPQGKGSQLHNRREYEKIGKPIPDNIDVSKSSENITLVDKDKKKTRPAKCQIDKAGGFSYNGFSGSDGNPNHEYMRDKLTYSP